MNSINVKKLVQKVILSAALVVTVVACGDKNRDDKQLNAFQQSCVSNCQDISPIPFFTVNTTAQSQTYGYWGGNATAMRINLSFAGQNLSQTQQQNQNYNSWASPAMNYSGRVSVVGTVTVNSVLNLGFCPQVPAGQYSLATQTAGQWNQGQISGIRFVITGPVSMTALLLNASASEQVYGYSSSTRLWGNLQVETVNGYYCQGANFYLY